MGLCGGGEIDGTALDAAAQALLAQSGWLLACGSYRQVAEGSVSAQHGTVKASYPRFGRVTFTGCGFKNGEDR